MKSCYLIRLGGADCAIANCTPYYSLGWMITRINVPKQYRGQQHGRNLLKQITDDADREEIRLFLEIHPSGGLSYEQLEAWYMRAGFRRWKGIYLRRPRCLSSQNA